MPGFYEYLPKRGLTAADRTPAEKERINQVMGYKTKPKPINIKTDTSRAINQQQTIKSDAVTVNRPMPFQHQAKFSAAYLNALAEEREKYGVNRNTINSTASEYIDSIASKNSSWFKKFHGTSKLPISDSQYKNFAAQYDARKKTYGEDGANIWLDNQMKDIVAKHQPWYEQALNAFASIEPVMEAGALGTQGMLRGAANPILQHTFKGLSLPDNEHLSWWQNYLDHIIDNPTTRYAHDMQSSNASLVGQGLTSLWGINRESLNERILFLT